MLLPAMPAGAAVIFSNFGPDDSYNNSFGDTVGSPATALPEPPLPATESASAFMPATNYALDSIELGMVYFSGVNALNISLASDSLGEPGTILETIHFPGSVPGPLAPQSPIFAASVDRPLLTMGNQYWVIASATSATHMAWQLNTTGDVGPIGARVEGGDWTTFSDLRGGMRISGTAVAAIPEPSTYALMLAGLGVVVFAAKRARRKRTAA